MGGTIQKPKKMKSRQFIELLPLIYYRLIVLNKGYKETAEWLKKEHDLDLTAKSGTTVMLSTYMNKYGDIKEARKSYQQTVLDKKALAASWFEHPMVTPLFEKKPVKSVAIDNKPINEGDKPINEGDSVEKNKTNEASNNNQSQTTTPANTKGKPLSDVYNIPKKPTRSVDPLAGFDDLDLNSKL